MTKIGVIGLGNMGYEMASNLSKNKYDVFGFDSNKAILDNKQDFNFKFVSNIEDLLSNIDVLITMLPNGKIVNEVLQKSSKLLSPHTIIIDSSTISVLEAQKINEFCQKSNLFFLDAPVSGGTIGAKNATLTFMIGGEHNILKKVEKILLTMGSKIVHCGDCGMGQAAKMCNNMILAATMTGVSEAINLSEKVNLDTQKLFEVVSTSTAFSWAINNYFPVANIGPESPADNDFNPGFSAELMLKDLSIAVDTKTYFNVETPMTDQTVKLYKLMKEYKMSKLDFSAIINLLKKMG